mmetsp:Transcript_48528/g.141348  ORF Transcript_48528/g.141348 Transcript_48528/m.141348 type:complete len:128 (-) Transcript_48528:293-676(-)
MSKASRLEMLERAVACVRGSIHVSGLPTGGPEALSRTVLVLGSAQTEGFRMLPISAGGSSLGTGTSSLSAPLERAAACEVLPDKDSMEVLLAAVVDFRDTIRDFREWDLATPAMRLNRFVRLPAAME